MTITKPEKSNIEGGSQLEQLLSELENTVKRLLENPSLGNALNTNLASLKLKELLYDIESYDGGIPLEMATTYSRQVEICLRKFQEMLPRLNGEARHVDLYSEQMRGRILLVNKMRHY